MLFVASEILYLPHLMQCEGVMCDVAMCHVLVGRVWVLLSMRLLVVPYLCFLFGGIYKPL